MILAGDIGGTNTRPAVVEATDQHFDIVVYDRFPSRDYAALDDIVQAFVSAHDLSLTQACFGVAGPIRHGRCEVTNLAWVVDARRPARVIGLDWERVLSGPGLHNIYRFLRDTGRAEEPAWLREEIQQHDPPAVISRAGL